MSGIIGVTGSTEVVQTILDGLTHLEYRGYDSAGLATLSAGAIELRRTPGKLEKLRALIDQVPISGTTGIGHTRWATFGAPTERNAQPQANKQVAVVQNGIIENFTELRKELEETGHKFSSETDTEVSIQLLAGYLTRLIHQGWRTWCKPLIGHRIRLRDLNPADFGAHARQG